VLEKIAQSGSFFIHIWNKMLSFKNRNYTMGKESGAAYAEIARVFCPRTFEAVEYF
jgi:hypothetical protein